MNSTEPAQGITSIAVMTKNIDHQPQQQQEASTIQPSQGEEIKDETAGKKLDVLA